MSQSPNADVPFVERRALLEDSLGSDRHTRSRLLCNEVAPPAKNSSFQVDCQNGTLEGKFRTLGFEGGNYGGQEDSKLTLPYFIFTKSTDFSFPAKIRDLAGEIAVFESAAKAVSNKDNRETISKQPSLNNAGGEVS